jgi:hypothetical protein
MIGVQTYKNDGIALALHERATFLRDSQTVKPSAPIISSQLPVQAVILVDLFPVQTAQFFQGLQDSQLFRFLEREPLALKTFKVQVEVWHQELIF